MKKALKSGSQTINNLITTLNTTEEAIKGVIAKNSQKFAIAGDTVSLIGDNTPTQSPNESPKPDKRKADEIETALQTENDKEEPSVSTPCNPPGWWLAGGKN